MIKHEIFIFLNRYSIRLRKLYTRLISTLGIYDKSNKIILVKHNGERVLKKRIKNLYVVFKGKNNLIEIHEPFFMRKIYFEFLGDNNIFVLKKESCIHNHLNVAFQSNNIFTIDKGFHVKSLDVTFKNSINTSIKIGKDCMFSSQLSMRVGDSHTIYDINTKKILNMPKNIEIGNHVWLAAGVKVLKGAKIPDNCIVGANSLVTKAFEEENCIIAGSPAKIIKKGVNWHQCGQHEWDAYKEQV